MKKRLIGAAILMIVIIPLLIIGKIPYAIGVGLFGLLAYQEIIFLKKQGEKKLPMPIIVVGVISLILLIYSDFDSYSILLGVNYQKIALITIMLLLPTVFYYGKEEYNVTRAFRLLGMILFLGVGFNLFISIFNYNKNIFLYLISIPVFCDTFAYLAGSLIGKHKCAANISPKKSWEGCIIGSILGTVVATFIFFNIVNSNANVLSIIGITFILSIIGQLGDLFFSAIKREYGIKDYSNIIPGHGGILDRFDSLIFVMIGYLLFYYYL